MDWCIPEWITTEKSYCQEWLRAFFDGEAYVGKGRICIQCVNREGLRQVGGMLGRFGIRCREYQYNRKNANWNTNYHLVIGGKAGREAFLKRIGFNHKKKLERLNADVA